MTVLKNSFNDVRRQAVFQSGGSGIIQSNVIIDCGGFNIGGTDYSAILTTNADTDILFNRLEQVARGIEILGGGSPQLIQADTVRISNNIGIYINNRSVADTIRFCDLSQVTSDAVYLRDPLGTVIENCLIYDCERGIRAQALNSSGRSCYITYTTIANCSGWGIWFDSINSNVTWLVGAITNSIIVSNGSAGIEDEFTTDEDIRFVNVWNNNPNYVTATCDDVCISINPLFVDAANDDYHLLSNSPLKVLGEGGTQMGRYGPDPGDVSGVGNDPTTAYPSAYLLQNYPNPFSRSTMITLMAREDANGVLDVFSITGRLVHTQPLWVRQGANEINFSADNVARGVYLYRISWPGFVETRKMIVR